MIRLIAVLIAVGLFAAGLAWLADRPGGLILTFGSYEFRTSIGIAAGLMLVLVAALFLVVRFLSFLWRTPGIFGRWISNKRARAGYLALSRGLVAAAAGDAPEALRLAKRSEALLGSPPLGLLLTAQAAQLDGDEEKQASSYRAMLSHPETEFLGLRGLFMQAIRRDDEATALALANRAYTLRPKTPWAANALFDMYARRGEWQNAQRVLDETARRRLLNSGIARRRRAVLQTALAKEAEKTGNAEAALTHALAAVNLSPGLTPAAIIAARRLTQSGRTWKAQDIIETAWSQTPHPDLAQAYEAIHPDEEPQARARRLRGLSQLNPSDFESRLLMAEQAIHEKRWLNARDIVAPIADNFPTARVCVLMATIVRGETGDELAAQGWMTRSVRAARDAQWICGHCGWAGPDWSATCPHCNAFDSLSWKAPGQEQVENLTFPVGHPLPVQAFDKARVGADLTPLLEGTAQRVGETAPWPRPPDDPGTEYAESEPSEKSLRPRFGNGP